MSSRTQNLGEIHVPEHSHLGEIHVPKNSHHDDEFGVVGISSLLIPRSPQDGQYVAKAEIVVNLTNEEMWNGMKKTLTMRRVKRRLKMSLIL